MGGDNESGKQGIKVGRCRSLRSSTFWRTDFEGMEMYSRDRENTEERVGKLVEGCAHPSFGERVV